MSFLLWRCCSCIWPSLSRECNEASSEAILGVNAQGAKEASKKEKLAKELETAASHEELKLKQLTKAHELLQKGGLFVHC